MLSFLGADSRFKRKKEIIDKFPIVFGDYYEPFLRHGSIFFNLYNHKRVFGKALLSSPDKDIVRAFTAVKEEPARVQKVLAHCIAKNSAAFYAEMSKQMSSPSTLIYCYRAGYARGGWDSHQFERFGHKMTSETGDLDVCSRYLNRWCEYVRWYNWETALDTVKENDLVFCDPQYQGWADDKYKWMECFLTGLKSQRKCHVVMIKEDKVNVL
jgi:site-specific DNA-adenine methylase